MISKFYWNEKYDGKCPDRIKRQVLKNSYKNGGIKAPDIVKDFSGDFSRPVKVA